MAVAGSLQLSHGLGLCKSQGYDKRFKRVLWEGKLHSLSNTISSRSLFRQRDSWSVHPSYNLCWTMHSVPFRSNAFRCHAFMLPGQGSELPALKAAASTALSRSYNVLKGSPLFLKLAPAICLITFTLWGLGPLMRQSRNLLFHKSDNSWKKSSTYYVMTSYLQPLLLWVGAALICRVLDPIVLPTEASQAVKQRLLNFVRSLSTVLAFAYCISSVIQQAQKFFMESNESSDARNMGFQFAGKAVYSAVWVAAVSLFMELLGFSTQKWLTAGGLGTVLLTLAGREIFTNFLSSIMIHATRPFVLNEWIQTKIEGYEVSGTVEHVGWWSPTIIRGEDREAVHIPNHKFTVNVVRNLSQKTHWRIKTHLAISHLDVSKINNIVADMRKVLAKNPQVEQQRLHRRVFLDNVNLENQGLLILVSCFVKTSHFEEYLCVKEAVLLDLLRVISHHRARLATPIRTMQKIYSESDLENIPYHDSFYNHGGMTANRPLLLIEPSYRINGEDKAKSHTRSGRVGGDSDGKSISRSMADAKVGNAKSESKMKESTKSETKAESKNGEMQIPNAKERTDVATASKSDPKASDKVTAKPSAASVPKTNSNAADKFVSETKDASSVSDDLTQSKTGSNGKQARTASPGHAIDNSKFEKPSVSSLEASTADPMALLESSHSKQEVDRKLTSQPSVSSTSLEENIVLGVALDGSKRTLPIEDGMASHPFPVESKEVSAAVRNGTKYPNAEKDKKSQISNPPTATSGDQ